jgi:hypothetical protein
MPKFKFPFQDLETIPKLIKDFLQQEIPKFSVYQFTLENALLQAEKKAHNYTLEQRKILVDVLRAISEEKMISIKKALNDGMSKASICRTFEVKRSTLIDSLNRENF